MEAGLTSNDFKQIEDIIEAQKKLGHYNVFKSENSIFSSHDDSNRYVRFEDTITQNESVTNLKLTDSEITIIRVGCGINSSKRCQSKWDMHDVAIPGDGSHLGESPSLVNLATTVIQFPVNVSSEGKSEYLVPLSSWDPYYKEHEKRKIHLPEIVNSSHTNTSLANKLTKFIKKHCKKPKSS